jgi:hypothetical protein
MKNVNRFNDSYANLNKKVNSKEGVFHGSRFQRAYLSLNDVDEIFNHDGLMNVIIEAPVMDAFLTGIESDNEKIEKLYSELSPIMREAIILSRAFGGAFIYFQNGLFKALSPLDVAINEIEANPLRDDYLNPTSLQITETGEELDIQNLIFIHEKSTSNYRKGKDGLGVGVVEKVIEHIVRWDSSLSQSTDILNQLNQTVIKFQDLNMVINEGREDDIIKRLDTINVLKSNLSILAIDKEDEFVNITKSLGNTDSIIQENAIAISAVTKIPYSRLFGKTVTGIGQTNDNDMKNYYDTVVSDVREYYVRNIFVKMMEFLGVYSDFEFKNIIEPSEIDRLKAKEIDVNIRLKLLKAGIITEKNFNAKN